MILRKCQFLMTSSFVLLFCHFLKSEVTNELKSIFLLKAKKTQGYLIKTDQNFTAGKSLVWSVCVWRTATDTFLLKI